DGGDLGPVIAAPQTGQGDDEPANQYLSPHDGSSGVNQPHVRYEGDHDADAGSPLWRGPIRFRNGTARLRSELSEGESVAYGKQPLIQSVVGPIVRRIESIRVVDPGRCRVLNVLADEPHRTVADQELSTAFVLAAGGAVWLRIPFDSGPIHRPLATHEQSVCCSVGTRAPCGIDSAVPARAVPLIVIHRPFRFGDKDRVGRAILDVPNTVLPAIVPL